MCKERSFLHKQQHVVQSLLYFYTVLTNTNVQNEKDSFHNHLRVDGICIERAGLYIGQE
jgi:hypothetical protein